MAIINILLWGFLLFLTLSFACGIRMYGLAGAGITIQTRNTALLFTIFAITSAVLGVSPLHFLWMIPLAFIAGGMALVFPFSMLNGLGGFYGRLCCIGLDAELVSRNVARAEYYKDLIRAGYSNEEATRMSVERFPHIEPA